MVANTHRPRSLRRRAGSHRSADARRTGRRLGALLSTAVLAVGATGCGLEVQTTQPYTPAEGMNLNVGDVAVRNLVIVSRSAGTGYVSASLLSPSADRLTGVSGNAIKADGSVGSPLSSTLSAPITLGGSDLVVLTDQPLITIDSPDLTPGLTADLVLTFSEAGRASLRVPVLDGTQPPYASISPSPSSATVAPVG